MVSLPLITLGLDFLNEQQAEMVGCSRVDDIGCVGSSKMFFSGGLSGMVVLVVVRVDVSA